MVVRVSDKNQNYNNVTKLLVKPRTFKIRFFKSSDALDAFDLS